MLTEMTEEHIQELESQLLALVPATGSVGNVTLLRQLMDKGWSETKYWAVRERILDRGILVTGRGRGGSVKRAEHVIAPVSAVMEGPDTSTSGVSAGADVLELRLASGGRLLAIIQGKKPAQPNNPRPANTTMVVFI